MRRLLSVALLVGCGGAVEDANALRPSADAPASYDPAQSAPSPSPPSEPSSNGSPAPAADDPAPAQPSDLVAAHPAPPGMKCQIDYASRPGVAGGRIYWPIDCVDASENRRSIVASAPVTGGTAAVGFSIAARFTHELGPFAVDGHVVFQPGGSSIFFIKAGTTDAMTLPYSSDQCISVSSDPENIYCIPNAVNQSIAMWPIDSYVGVSATKVVDGLGAGCGSLTTDSGYVYYSCNGGNPGIFRFASKGKPERLVATDFSGLISARGSNIAWAYGGDGGIGPVNAGPDSYWPIVDPSAWGTVWFMRGKGATKRSIEKITADGTTTVVLSGLDRYTKFTVDATHVYWSDGVGIHRRAKP